MQNYIIIDPNQNKCVNLVVWDGKSQWSPNDTMVHQLSDGTIKIGDSVSLVNGAYVYASSPAGPTAEQLFNVDQFATDLLTAFAADDSILPYYAIVKDLAAFQNFSGMKQMALGLEQSGKLTSDEINLLIGVLANQNIVWANL